MTASSPVISQNSPVFEPGQRVLDTCASFAMLTPRTIAKDAVLAEDRRNELWDTAIATVGEDSLVAPTDHLDVRGPVVNNIIAIARTASGDGDHAEITATYDDLGVA